GSVAMALPGLFVIGAVRLMRTPQPEPEHRGRAVVGWTALFLGAAGLLHLGFDRPQGTDRLERAGGLLGKLAGGLLAEAVTGWVAVPLLVLLAGFGLL